MSPERVQVPGDGTRCFWTGVVSLRLHLAASSVFRTHQCGATLQALKAFKAARAAAAFASVGMLLGLSSVLGRGAAPVSPLPIGLLAAAAASAVAWRLASNWVQKFYYVDYVHQEHA